MADPSVVSTEIDLEQPVSNPAPKGAVKAKRKRKAHNVSGNSVRGRRRSRVVAENASTDSPSSLVRLLLQLTHNCSLPSPQGRLLSEVTLEQLQALYHLPSKEAASRLGIGTSSLPPH